MTPDPWCAADEHGDRTAYRLGCRCRAARAAMAAYAAALRKDNIMGRPRLVDATGTRRRIEALHALGWTGAHIGALCGDTDPSMPRKWRTEAKISARSAQRVTVAYDRLSMKPGPSYRTRARALKAGWPPPLAWDDDTIDDPAATPAPCTDLAAHTIPYDDVEYLARCGGTWDTIAARIGFSRNSIETGLARRDRLDVSRLISRNSQSESELARRSA